MRHFSVFKRIICFTLVFVTLLSVMCVSAYDDAKVTKLYNNDPIEKAGYKAYAVMNANSDRVLLSKNGDQKLPCGNLVKLMLLSMAYDAIKDGKLNLDTVLSVPKGVTELSGNTVYLNYYKKETITVDRAINAICVNSAHDAAYCLAMGMASSESEFVAKMNKKAEEMGLKNTHFTDCTGRERKEQYTTANDMVKIAAYLVEKYPQVTELSSQKMIWFEHNTGEAKTMVSTTNGMIRYYKNCDGLCATSDDTIGYCAANTALIKEQRLVCVVLGASDDNNGMAVSRKILEQCAAEFQYTALAEAGTFVRKVAIDDGVSKTIKAETKGEFKAFIKVEDMDKVEKVIQPKKDLSAPIKKGDTVGEIIFKVGNEELGHAEMVAAEDVEEAGFFTKLVRWFLSLFGLE